VDIITQVAADMTGLRPGQVLGSGTTLDTARFRFNLGEHYDIDPRSVHAWILAEHGDSAVPVWSLASVAGVQLRDYAGPNGKAWDDAVMQDLFVRTRDAAYAIIERKKSTYYAIGIALLRLVEAILRDHRTILPVCAPLSGQHGVSGMALSLPMLVGCRGVEAIMEIPLSAHEADLFRKSGELLKARLAAAA
jgi:L-lactate dehydrogenase